MKKTITSVLIFVFIMSCTKVESPKPLANLDKPIVMNVYCQQNTESILWKVQYEYNHDTLISQKTIYGGVINNTTTFEYNSNHQLIREIYESGLGKTITTLEYNATNQVINRNYRTINYGENGQILNEREIDAPLVYENNKLIKEWNSWGGFSTYEYKLGNLITKVDYNGDGVKRQVTKYKYLGVLKIGETIETAEGNIMSIKSFKYDSGNRLTSIIDNENTVEENFYSGNKLMEKKTYYYGIDPGFSPCLGNYTFTYEY
jgi:hypothetical protein